MISDQSEFRVQIRRLSFVMIRTSYRWICNHPFLLGFVGFLYFLHRYCPLLFSPLVTASPVLVCTFVLLGTILSFGETNVPEIEKESEIKHEAALFRTEVSRDVNATVVERGDKSYTVESFLSKEKNVVEDGNDDADRLREKQLSEVEDDGRPFDYTPLVDETLDASKQDSHVRFEEKAFVLELEKRGESVEEILNENGGKHGSREEQSRRNGGSLDEIVDDSKEDDQLDVSPISPWRPMRSEDDDDDDADRDDSLDSESDGAESSSPDASMTDIIPMLDELHPLLHSETPIRDIADGEGSDAASEGASRTSSDEGMESDVDSESHGEEGDNENEKEEEEVEKKEDKDDESKSAIKWTEADQRNVMDLGSLELERNQRLENLIARRRARHNMRLMAERNLIDFDSADIPFNMPPISTARQNPFDASYDYDDMGLPPIPGSAPSTMFARRNPFDLPYEPNEEKPDLKGDGFQEEFPSQQPKEPVFRRHESFSVGPSMLGGHRQDRLRPFFVLERLANEGTSYYPFERQLSEVSESKVSSVPDTESVCTVLEDDDKKVDERYTDRETEIDKVDMASDHDEEKSHPASDHDEGKTHMASDHDEEKSQSASDHDEEKSHPASDHDEEKSHSASDHDEEKSHSSEDSDFDEQVDSRKLHHDVAEIILGSGETQHEQSNMMEEETSDKSKLDEENHSDSDSSFSEKEEKIPDISEGEAMLISDQKVDLQEESGASSQPSFRELEIHGRGLEDDNNHDEVHGNEYFVNAPELDESAIHDLRNLVDVQHKEPVYDSSPSGSRFPSFSSVSSDYKPDLPGKNREVVEENEEKEREVGETSTHATGDASLFISEVGIDGHNKSVVEQSPGEDQVPTRVVFSRNITFHEYHDAPEDAAELSCLTSDSSSSPAESPEYTTPMVGEGSRADFFQEVVYDELDHVAERLDQLTDLHEISQSPPEEITEEEDEIKEMDEVLLSELDTVGDFSVKEIVTDSEPGPSSIGPDASNELTKALPVLEARSLEDIDSASQQIHEGSEVEYVILPNTVQDQLDQENCGNSTDTESDVSLLQSTSKEDLENAMNQAVVESMSKQPKSPQPDGESGEIKCEVETEPSESLVEERSLDETNVPLNNIAEKEEKESIPEETTTTTTSHVSPVLTRALEEIPKLSEPTEAPGPSNVTLSDEVVTEEAKSENAGKTDANTVQDQLAQENCEISKDTGSDLEVVEATSKDDLENAMNQAVVEGMSMQPKSPESDGGSREIKCEVETKPSETLVEARSLDETNAPLNNTAEKEEEESIPKESTTDVSPVETRALEEIQKPSEPKEEMSMELISERVVIPTEAAGPSNVPLRNEVMAEKETQGSTDANVQILEPPPSESLVEERSLDEEEHIPKERTTEVSLVETQAPEEIPKPSEPKEETSMEVSSERVVIPTEVAGPSNVILSDEVVTEESKTETPGNADANVQSLESIETSEENIAEKKRKEGEED